MVLTLLPTLVFNGVNAGAQTPSKYEIDGVPELSAVMQDFQKCMEQRDFSCADINLRAATALATSSKERSIVATAKRDLASEKRMAAAEIAVVKSNFELVQAEDAQRSASSARILHPPHPQTQSYQSQEIESQPSPSLSQSMQGALNGTLQSYGRISQIHNNAMAGIQAQQAERLARERQMREQQRLQEQRQENDRRIAQLADARSQENAQRVRREQDEARAREQREVERARQEAADRAQRDRDRDRERAELAAKKRQEAQDEANAATEYLAALTRSTRLLARKCPDGEGKYYIVGKKPNIKPETVSCVDVHYRAQCVNSTSFTDGVGNNFVGMGTDCFTGDTYPIEPKPACKVEEVQVTVRSFAACRR